MQLFLCTDASACCPLAWTGRSVFELFLTINFTKVQTGKRKKEMDWGLMLIGRREADAGAWDTLLVAKVRVRCAARGHFPGSCLVHQQTEG